MPLVPDWAPNVHPLLVHFPIALLVVAVLVDLFALIFHRRGSLRTGATVLYALGAIATVFTYLSGEQAADSVALPPQANPVVSSHADWALTTVWFFIVYALMRVFLGWRKLDQRLLSSGAVLVLAAVGIFFLLRTAERGGELVFRHAVGVKTSRASPPLVIAEALPTAPGIETATDGSWRWAPGEGAGQILSAQFDWLRGDPAAFGPTTVEDSDRGAVAALHAHGSTALLAAGPTLRDAQIDLLVNLEDFTGRFALLLHVQDSLSYDFAELEGGTVRLGRVEGGQGHILDERSIQPGKWIALRAVSSRRHFRAYINEKLVGHGHGKEPLPGRAGIGIQGNGTILVDDFVVQNLGEVHEKDPHSEALEKDHN